MHRVEILLNLADRKKKKKKKKKEEKEKTHCEFARNTWKILRFQVENRLCFLKTIEAERVIYSRLDDITSVVMT